MIEKLELKHLKGYLGTGLIIKTQFVNGGVGTVGFEREMTLFNCHKVDGIKIKPILRPLSDLTKPCLEGEKVPIVELAKLSDPEFRELLSIKNKYELFGCRYIDSNIDTVVFAFHKNINAFGAHFEFENNELTIACHQLELFEFMYEHHFDIYGLIESGLAIDINTL